MYLFIQDAFNPETRFFYFAWILVVAASIVLHELAHGWVAIRHGDNTPIRLGRMTGNPLVHMGPYSIAVLLVFGMAWGLMPIDPTRMRGKYAEANVALAGPAMNLVLALLSLVALGLLIRFHGPPDAPWQENLYQLLQVAGAANILQALFNLIPIPPLDGSHVLANFNRRYARFIDDPSKQGMFLLAFAFVFALAGSLWTAAHHIAAAVLSIVVG